LKYSVELKPQALKDLRRIPSKDRDRILSRLERQENGLAGDVKKLTHFVLDYRLRVGEYRVLFEIEGKKIIVYRVVHRREAYRK
jgi:mRNA interferase RelE/StbE